MVYLPQAKKHIKNETNDNFRNKEKYNLIYFCFGKNTDYTDSKLKELSNVGSGNFANILNADEGKQHLLEEAQAVKKVP